MHIRYPENMKKYPSKIEKNVLRDRVCPIFVFAGPDPQGVFAGEGARPSAQGQPQCVPRDPRAEPLWGSRAMPLEALEV